MQLTTAGRRFENRLAALIVLLLTGILGVCAATLTRSPAAAQASTAPTPPAARVAAVDFVSPVPVELAFAKPASTSRPAAARRTPAVRRVARPARVEAKPALSTSCSGTGWQGRRGADALGSLRHAVPAGVTLSFLPGRGDLKGMTYFDRHHVDVFVGSCAAESDSLLRHVVAHELGHAVDSLHMTAQLRADYLAARGIAAGTPWFGCDRCQDFATPAGDFAETYAQWQRGAGDSRSQLAAPASAGQLADLAARFFQG